MRAYSRRALLAGIGGATAAMVAGCLDSDDGGPYDAGDGQGTNVTASNGEPNSTEPDPDAAAETAIPLASEGLPVAYEFGALRDETVSGGVPQDGIPSIDDPSFEPVSDVGDRIDDGDPVFGVVIDGEAKVYPQSILVHHEIVNDALGGESIAVTYCPLTGTAMGFFRNGVEFGVSGRLLNSNLVMYDRENESRWPQMLATATEGPLEGASLQEFPVFWSPWEQWREAYPDSQVLTESTGYARDYGSDPYGSYNPRAEYYEPDSPTMFEPLAVDDRHPNKRMFLGVRLPEGTIAVERDRLAEDGLIGISVDAGEAETETDPARADPESELALLAVWDERIGAGHLYRHDGEVYERGDDNDVLDQSGTAHNPHDLPLEAVYAFEAMWFAWIGFYPDSAVVD